MYEDKQKSFATLISVNVEEYFRDNTPIKKTLQIPKWADDLGKRTGVNFSRLLTDAISEVGLKLPKSNNK